MVNVHIVRLKSILLLNSNVPCDDESESGPDEELYNRVNQFTKPMMSQALNSLKLVRQFSHNPRHSQHYSVQHSNWVLANINQDSFPQVNERPDPTHANVLDCGLLAQSLRSYNSRSYIMALLRRDS